MLGTELAVGALVVGSLAAGLVVGFMLGFLVAAFMDTASREDDAMERRRS